MIPEFAEEDPSQATEATTLSQYYNTELARRFVEPAMKVLPDGTNLHEFDLYDYNASLLADATALGFTNTTDPCFIAAPESAATNPGCGVDGANIASYVYWNDVHPTARVQALWAAGFEQAVPEPSTWAMLLTGFAGLAFAARRRARTAS